MMNRRNLLAAGLGLAAVAGLAAQSGRAQARGPRADYFPNVTVTTHEGRRVRFYDDLIAGRLVAINMMYAQCTNRCPPMTANLKEVHRMLGEHVNRDVFMYSITLQPHLDRPRDLAEYVREHDVPKGWHFLTGEPQDIEAIRLSLGFYSIDPVVDADRTQHTGMVRVGNEALDRWCTSPSLGKPRRIVEAIQSMAAKPLPLAA